VQYFHYSSNCQAGECLSNFTKAFEAVVRGPAKPGRESRLNKPSKGIKTDRRH